MNLIGDGALRSVTNGVARLKSGPCYLPGQLLCSSTLCSTLVHCVQHWSPTLCLTQNIFLPSVHKYSTAAVFYVICQNLLCIYLPHPSPHHPTISTSTSNAVILSSKKRLPLNSSCQRELKGKHQLRSKVCWQQ